MRIRVISAIALLVVACSERDALSCGEENWDHLGVNLARVESLTAPDSVLAADTVKVELFATIDGADWVVLSRVDAVRSSDRVDLSVWADAYRWTGCGVMPPTELMVHYQRDEPPPFAADSFGIVAHQPGGSTMEKWIRVVR